MIIPCFEILGRAAILCRVCGLASPNANDLENLYCGSCHEYHKERTLQAISTLSARRTPVRARVKGATDWTECNLLLASGNGQSLILECDEGLPLRAAGLNRETGKMNAPLWFNPETLAYEFLMTGEPYEIEI